ncbi:MAG TPA: sigma-70 family RNA polymerase sigma factor [Blastocatellia bacterium]|nr:sigma-70 family RNA polymerase sigma factor [Blastocatellia bacterium]
MSPSPQEVTQLLIDWRNGDRDALDKLMPIVYEELRRLAHRYMSRERPDHTLQTSALVNEAYLRLANQKNVEWQNRAHFFAIAANVMRRLLVNHARSRGYAKRGGGARQVTLDEQALMSRERDAELVALDEALGRLTAIDPRKGQIVELRYFGGLSVEEVAEVLGISDITVKREWGKAKAWLYRELSQG